MNSVETAGASNVEVVRELDYRSMDGLEVRLLWDSRENTTWLEVTDSKDDVRFNVEVPHELANKAFHHPFTFRPAGELAVAEALAA